MLLAVAAAAGLSHVAAAGVVASTATTMAALMATTALMATATAIATAAIVAAAGIVATTSVVATAARPAAKHAGQPAERERLGRDTHQTDRQEGGQHTALHGRTPQMTETQGDGNGNTLSPEPPA